MTCCEEARRRDKINTIVGWCMINVAGHEHVVTYLNAIAAEGRIAHAYLFVGPTGIGKSTVARAWAQELLAHEGPLHIHPDYYELDPGIPDAPEPIKMVRAFTHFMSEKPLLAVRKVALILRAELLTPESCDALLKTIEEPPGDSIMIITVSHHALVPATIRSRCQMVEFAPVSLEKSHDERDAALTALLAEKPAARFRWINAQFANLRDAEEKRTRAQELVGVFERVMHAECGTDRVPDGSTAIRAFRDTRHALEHNVSPQLVIEHLVMSIQLY